MAVFNRGAAGKGVASLCLLMATTVLAASSAWAANCHDERQGSGVPTGNAFWKPMQFIDGGVVSGYGRVIYAVGEVEAAKPVTDNGKTTLHYLSFDAFLKAKNIQAGALVIFHSPGGNVAGGFAIGEAIRSNSLRASVGQPQIANASTPLTTLGSSAPAKGECDSACSLAFLGGVRRSVPTGSLYGVHAGEEGAPSSPLEPPGEEFYSGEVLAGETSGYVEKMGIDPSWLKVAEACSAGFEYIQYLTPAQLASTKTITTFTTSWGLTDDNDAIVVSGDNPDSSGIPNFHDDLIFACAGTPRRVQMRVDYLPEAYNAGEHGGVRATPPDFIKMVSGYSLSGVKPAAAPNNQPIVVTIAQSDIVAPLAVTDTHHVTTAIALTAPVASLLNESDTVQFIFNKQTTPVGQVNFDLSAEGHQFINDYSAACQ